MNTVTSKDGTRIAYDKLGAGPAVIVVDGALGYRGQMGQDALAAALADHFTVYYYDRRGRGESTDTLPYAVEREVEDIEALIRAAGGPAHVFGISSGAALAMEAAIQLGSQVKKLAMYEAPYNSDPAAMEAWKAYTQELDALLAAGRRGDAVGLFMQLVGASAEEVEGVRQTPIWPIFEGVAPTLAYDHSALLGDTAAVPTARAAAVAVPALVMDGAESYPFMRVAAEALAEAMPQGEHRTLAGQTHEVAAEALAPVLVEFFKADAASEQPSAAKGERTWAK